ncbi:YihY/virulence factor BrkB family protein [Sinirhodobacter populi]|uniref:YihY/virulence factor BrkB family protein n=1 Tax=Paenirhodobacter populi TaxID=2306993 RepID=A0A443J065_9RHOB|nr:YihY/virulence factor BrkB family protein [Sinirhodobacter populi]
MIRPVIAASLAIRRRSADLFPIANPFPCPGKGRSGKEGGGGCAFPPHRRCSADPTMALHMLSFLRRYGARLETTNIMLISAGVAFYAMLAVFPGLTATIAIWSTFADPGVIHSYMEVAHTFIPPEAFALLNNQVTELLSGPRGVIGLPAIISVLVTLWSARAGVGALIEGINLIHGTKPRNTIFGFFFGYLLTIALVGVMLIALATIVIVPLAVTFLPFEAPAAWLTSDLPWVAMLMLMLTALGILYRYGPNDPAARDPMFSFGAILAALVWGAASLGLTFYLTNFGNYNRIYGSIGAVIALMMWLYVSAISVLLGAALNAEIAATRQGQKNA